MATRVVDGRVVDGRKEDKEKGGVLANFEVCQGAVVLQLFVGKDEALAILGKALIILNLRLHSVNGIQAVNLKSDGPAR
jgi:hypothetical protein